MKSRFIIIDILIMGDKILQFSKENFIPVRKENINTHYDVIAKVYSHKCRNWAREHTELFTKAKLRALKGLGGLSKKYQRQFVKTRLLFRTKSKF